MLLDILQCRGQPPTQTIIWPKMSIVLRLKNAGWKNQIQILLLTFQGLDQSGPSHLFALSQALLGLVLWSLHLPRNLMLQALSDCHNILRPAYHSALGL